MKIQSKIARRRLCYKSYAEEANLIRRAYFFFLAAVFLVAFFTVFFTAFFATFFTAFFTVFFTAFFAGFFFVAIVCGEK